MDRYGRDVLADPSKPRASRSRPLPADPGLVVEEVQTGWVGAVLRCETSGGMRVVVLEDRRGKVRAFPLGHGFWVDGQPVELVAPAPQRGSQAPERTASGSVAAPQGRARVAAASRIWVEGTHDAELVEQVWGHDLRVEAVVVEPLGGIDDLTAEVRRFAPAPDRRLGVLVDHLVPGSKESRIASEALRAAPAGTLLVLGHPYVDVWQAVRPQRLGLAQWPSVPHGTSWKHGVLAALGWAHETQQDVAEGWRRIRGSVRDYRDLEPAFLGRMEELIDFVTGGAS